MPASGRELSDKNSEWAWQGRDAGLAHALEEAQKLRDQALEEMKAGEYGGAYKAFGAAVEKIGALPPIADTRIGRLQMTLASLPLVDQPVLSKMWAAGEAAKQHPGKEDEPLRQSALALSDRCHLDRARIIFYNGHPQQVHRDPTFLNVSLCLSCLPCDSLPEPDPQDQQALSVAGAVI